VTRLVTATRERFGRIDVLVNNAGLGMRATVGEGRPADARQLFEVNFFGLLRCIQAVLPVMRQQDPGPFGVRGQIVNVGSILSAVATPRNSIYCATKYAVRALSDALRLEEKRNGIEVILIMPGYIDTPFFDNMIRYQGPARVSSLRGASPELVGRAIWRACRRHRREVIITAAAKLGALLKRLSPRLLDFGLARTSANP
jgi:short-subunit dehydrogenase